MKKRILSIVLTLACVLTSFCACSKTETTQSDEDFRVTAYVTLDSVLNFDGFQKEYINEVTDVILIGAARFDEEGNINLDENYEAAHKYLKDVVDSLEGKRFYLTLLGPGSQSDSDDWYEQMADQAKRHNTAFENENFISSIKELLDKDGYDGVYFDYEYPIKKTYWKSFNKFIVKLDEALGDTYKIGIAVSNWDIGQDKKAREATDFVQIMSYDSWEEDGTHSSMAQAEKDIKTFIKKGYDRKQLELGMPFYARPTTRDPYWYSYNGYVDKIDENGFCKDDETGLTFSFNTPKVIKEKTAYAIDQGLGGVMIWHWACDVPYDHDNSLFKAIDEAVKESQTQEK